MEATHPLILTAFLCLGLFGLWAGSEIAVVNTVRIARRLGVSDLFLGLTVVAFGTDLPELLVALDSASHMLRGIPSSGLIVGNAIGSSVSQITFVLGIAGWLSYVTIGRRQLRTIALELIAAMVLLFLIGFDGRVTRLDGAVLILAFAVYLFVVTSERKRGDGEEGDDGGPRPLWLSSIVAAVGIVIVLASSELTVDTALELAEVWGLQQAFVGAVIVGLGTSLPELAISVRAILRGLTSLSVGNVVGSNVFDLLIPIGAAALITDIEFDRTSLFFDLPYLFLATLLVIFFLWRVKGLQRWEGGTLVAVFALYGVVRFLLST